MNALYCFVTDEMYVLSATNRRVSVQLLGKDKIQDKLNRFEDLRSASLFYLGVSSSGPPSQLGATVPSKLNIFIVISMSKPLLGILMFLNCNYSVL